MRPCLQWSAAPLRREPSSTSSPSIASTSVRAWIGEPQLGHSLAARGTTALQPSQSLGSDSPRSRARWPRILSLFAVVEMVLTDVRHHAETQMVAGVIEDETVGLAFGSAQAAADRLDEENSAPCRPRVDDATDHRQVDAGREDADVANDFRRPGAEAIEDALTVRPIGDRRPCTRPRRPPRRSAPRYAARACD